MTTSSPRSSSVSRRSLRLSPAPPPSVSAGAASSPIQASSAASACTTAIARPSSVSSTDWKARSSYLLWRPPIASVADTAASPCRLQYDDRNRVHALGCRHGLFLLRPWKLFQVLVWDPFTGDQHCIAFPEAFQAENTVVNGTVLRPPGDVQHFQVVLAVADRHEKQHARALACVYSSKTGLWGKLISTPISYQADVSGIPTRVDDDSTVLVGDSLYWLLGGKVFGILELDLVKQNLAVIRVPVEMCGKNKCFKMTRAEGGGLGFLLVSPPDYTAQLWKIKTDCDGVASWGLAKTIEVDKILSLKSEEKGNLYVLGFAEENNVVLVWTRTGIFLIHLESLKFKKFFEPRVISYYHPLESVYAAGACVAGGHDGPELLRNT